MIVQTIDQFVAEGAKYSADQSHANLAVHSLDLLSQIRVWHWQTEIGDQHTALGGFYDDLSTLVDGLIEVIMGKYGRIAVNGVNRLAIVNLNDTSIVTQISNFIGVYDAARKTFTDSTEIQNILDEVVALCHKISYLLTMS
jgi:hypothetical protein